MSVGKVGMANLKSVYDYFVTSRKLMDNSSFNSLGDFSQFMSCIVIPGLLPL